MEQASTALVPVQPDALAQVDPETGIVPQRLPPGAKLREDGKRELFRLVIEGWNDDDIASWLVEAKYVLSYTPQAVNYWRQTPKLKTALAQRNHAAFQEGWASVVHRVRELGTMAEALRDEILEQDRRTGRLKIKDTMNKQAQAMMIREFGGIMDRIANIVDDPKKREVDLNVNVNQGAKAEAIGATGASREELLARFRSAGVALQQDMEEAGALPSSVGNGKSGDDAIDAEYTVNEDDPA